MRGHFQTQKHGFRFTLNVCTYFLRGAQHFFTLFGLEVFALKLFFRILSYKYLCRISSVKTGFKTLDAAMHVQTNTELPPCFTASTSHVFFGFFQTLSVPWTFVLVSSKKIK